MANAWFRLYAEFADDPKVQTMSEAMQRRLVMLFCEWHKCETLSEAEREFRWRITPEELAATKAVFLEKQFIDENWELLNFERWLGRSRKSPTQHADSMRPYGA